MKTLCQSTVLKEWYIPKTEEILYQKVSLTPRPPSKNILKDTWQVQREHSHQLGTVTGRLVADEGKMGPKIDFRVQGFPHAAVVQEDERTRGIRRLVHQVKNHPNKGALIAEPKTNKEEKPQFGECGILLSCAKFLPRPSVLTVQNIGQKASAAALVGLF